MSIPPRRRARDQHHHDEWLNDSGCLPDVPDLTSDAVMRIGTGSQAAGRDELGASRRLSVLH
jgi:hypothetical protein